jgi:hypothetical protein
MKARRAIILATAALLVAPMARSGHEQPVYPSYYPHEIDIRTMAPEQAGDLLREGKLHAYVGSAPPVAGARPGTIGTVESLGSFVIVRINPDSPMARGDGSACAAAGAIVRHMIAQSGEVVVHPYPVTPWHGDYLNHADRADAARQRIVQGDAPPPDGLKVRAASVLTKSLIRPEWLANGRDWDAAIEETSVSRLVADATVALNGWLGPRWVRSGWFHAYRVLGSSMRDPAQKQDMEARFARLQAADYEGNVERINQERELVGSLVSGCRAMVAGYTMKREYFNAEFSAGIENISFDALEGFSSPMFLRTVKLKDFPWNGWLHLALEAPPDAAWNPIGGFTDPFGRLAWYAIADPAAVPSPYEVAWTLNRISEVEASPKR